MQVITNEKSEFAHKYPTMSNDEILNILKREQVWVLDTETYPRNWNTERKKIEKQLEGTRKNVELALQKRYKELAVNVFTLLPRLFQIEVAEKYIFLIDVKSDPLFASSIADLLPEKSVIVHNAKFDLKIFYHLYGVYPKEVFDTYIASLLIEHGRSPYKVKHGLGEVLKRWEIADISKGEQSSDWSGHLTDNQLFYAINDVMYLRQLARKLGAYLNKVAVNKGDGYFVGSIKNKVFELEMKFIKTLVIAEIRGIPINTKKLNELLIEYKQHEAELKARFPLNFNSPKQVTHHLRTLGYDVESSSEEVLKELASKGCEFCSALLEARKITKMRAMLEEYLSFGSKIHPTFWQLTAISGRLSASNPNTQQIPRSIKEIFYANNCVGYDFPSEELRIMAEITQDPEMIEAFKRGEDLHTKTAQLITGKVEITKEERTLSKGANFLFLYGGGVNTFIKNIFKGYGIRLTEAEGRSIREKFFKAYRKLAEYHRKNGELFYDRQHAIKYTLYGRRMIASSFTLANNLPVQGTGADILKLSAICFTEKAEQSGLKARIVNLIHDEIIIDNEDGLPVLKECMENAINSLLKSFKTIIE